MFEPLRYILIALMTAGVKEFFNRVLGVEEVPAYVAAVIVAVAGALVLFGNEWAAKIPSPYAPVVAAVVSLLIAIAGAFGLHALSKAVVARFGYKAE